MRILKSWVWCSPSSIICCTYDMVNEVNITTPFSSLKFRWNHLSLRRLLQRKKQKRGTHPSFFSSFFIRTIAMISASHIQTLTEAFLDGSSGFLVDIRVSEGNAISILLDDDEGTSIEKCIALSRYLESELDRDAEDFSLDVSSPGLDQPLKLHRQYVKNLGRDVQLKISGAGKVEGKLVRATESDVTIMIREKRRIEGRKAKEWVEEELTYPLDDLDWTKVQVSFKGNDKDQTITESSK
ncbi:MAG: ribosome assembly cofactor RimP [Flavobacteriales bacterium]